MEEPKTQSIFEIKVRSSSKVGEGTMSAHIEYKLDVKTSLASYKSSSFTVIRRYSDFVWLRDKLLEQHKGYLVPPLPEKAILNRFNSEFVEYRRRELERFLARVVEHPVLQASSVLQSFLQSESPQNEATMSSEVVKKDHSSTAGLFSFLGSSLDSISAINLTAQADPDQWFDAKRNYVLALESQLLAFSKAMNTLTRHRKELIQALPEFSLASSLLASTEADHDSPTSASFKCLAELATSLVSLDEKRVDEETSFYEDSLRDYIRMLAAVKEMLSTRNEKLMLYQQHSKQVDLKKEKLEKAKGSSSAKLTREIEEGEKVVQDSKDNFDAISEICKQELQNFEKMKTQDFNKMLVRLTQININYEVQVLDHWKSLLSELQS